ncbi:MAG: MotA/TolQ/ExbB proton channel family protein [Rhodospirillales bacterium]
MALASILGVLGTFGLFIGAIVYQTDNYMVFLDMPSFVIVFGGTLAATFMSYEPRYVILSLKLIMKIMLSAKISRGMLKAEVGRIIKWAYTVQKNGIPALETESKKAVKGDKFLKFGVDMVISGYSGDEVRDILATTIETTFGRNTVQVSILNAMASGSPAFGMLGTLVGLIVMLGAMGGDPSELGAGLSVALITTLYGVIFSRMIYMPAATKIMQREQIIRFRNYLVCEGLGLLADRKSPRFIQDKMNAYLDPALHFNIDKMKK